MDSTGKTVTGLEWQTELERFQGQVFCQLPVVDWTGKFHREDFHPAVIMAELIDSKEKTFTKFSWWVRLNFLCVPENIITEVESERGGRSVKNNFACVSFQVP